MFQTGLRHTLWADFIPVLAAANQQLNSAGARGDVLLQVVEAPHQSCQLRRKPLLSRGSISVFPKREQQLADVHNLSPYSQPGEGYVCKALNHQQRKQLSPREVCSLFRSGPTQSRATNPSRLPTTCLLASHIAREQ